VPAVSAIAAAAVPVAVASGHAVDGWTHFGFDCRYLVAIL
jgi:hypothetical protein